MGKKHSLVRDFPPYSGKAIINLPMPFTHVLSYAHFHAATFAFVTNLFLYIHVSVIKQSVMVLDSPVIGVITYYDYKM